MKCSVYVTIQAVYSKLQYRGPLHLQCISRMRHQNSRTCTLILSVCFLLVYIFLALRTSHVPRSPLPPRPSISSAFSKQAPANPEFIELHFSSEWLNRDDQAIDEEIRKRLLAKAEIRNVQAGDAEILLDEPLRLVVVREEGRTLKSPWILGQFAHAFIRVGEEEGGPLEREGRLMWERVRGVWASRGDSVLELEGGYHLSFSLMNGDPSTRWFTWDFTEIRQRMLLVGICRGWQF